MLDKWLYNGMRGSTNPGVTTGVDTFRPQNSERFRQKPLLSYALTEEILRLISNGLIMLTMKRNRTRHKQQSSKMQSFDLATTRFAVVTVDPKVQKGRACGPGSLPHSRQTKMASAPKAVAAPPLTRAARTLSLSANPLPARKEDLAKRLGTLTNKVKSGSVGNNKAAEGPMPASTVDDMLSKPLAHTLPPSIPLPPVPKSPSPIAANAKLFIAAAYKSQQTRAIAKIARGTRQRRAFTTNKENVPSFARPTRSSVTRAPSNVGLTAQAESPKHAVSRPLFGDVRSRSSASSVTYGRGITHPEQAQNVAARATHLNPVDSDAPVPKMAKTPKETVIGTKNLENGIKTIQHTVPALKIELTSGGNTQSTVADMDITPILNGTQFPTAPEWVYSASLSRFPAPKPASAKGTTADRRTQAVHAIRPAAMQPGWEKTLRAGPSRKFSPTSLDVQEDKEPSRPQEVPQSSSVKATVPSREASPFPAPAPVLPSAEPTRAINACSRDATPIVPHSPTAAWWKRGLVSCSPALVDAKEEGTVPLAGNKISVQNGASSKHVGLSLEEVPTPCDAPMKIVEFFTLSGDDSADSVSEAGQQLAVLVVQVGGESGRMITLTSSEDKIFHELEDLRVRLTTHTFEPASIRAVNADENKITRTLPDILKTEPTPTYSNAEEAEKSEDRSRETAHVKAISNVKYCQDTSSQTVVDNDFEDAVLKTTAARHVLRNCDIKAAASSLHSGETADIEHIVAPARRFVGPSYSLNTSSKAVHSCGTPDSCT
ncbi:hypothetical protein IEO21_07970 [Rhodonia placenta]|uniref:Uncharacterized protein n=1 Tax=Rhodonia placenta TaxID=104341 RepID=A0A8H7NX57_9APHY|nr:hypothetical protein IEO21_07970 [Postia placenta]